MILSRFDSMCIKNIESDGFIVKDSLEFTDVSPPLSLWILPVVLRRLSCLPLLSGELVDLDLFDSSGV